MGIFLGDDGKKKAKLVKVYGNHTGRRFAAVELPNGKRVDVLTRGPSDGSAPNAWGDKYPIEETRRPAIFEKAATM